MLKQVFVFFRSPELVNFRLKSLLETTFAQSKQICSFADGDTHTRSIDLVGVESNETWNPKCESRHSPFLARNANGKTHQARQVDLSRLRRSRSAASRPNKARSFRQEVDL